MKLLHFRNDKTGKEYLVISDVEDPGEWANPGFTLASSTELEDAPGCTLPIGQELVAR